MQPLATYEERRFDGRCDFSLFEHELVVRGKQVLRSDFETRHVLRQCDPTPDTFQVHSPLFRAGLALTLVCFVLSSSLVFLEGRLSLWPGIVGAMGLAFATLTLATARKVRFFCYKNLHGVPLFHVGQVGRHASECESFVEAVTTQINVATRESV